MTDDPQPTTSSVGTSRKAASVGGQVVAVVGIGVCIVLAIVVLLARGWAVDQVDSIATSIDDALAPGDPRAPGRRRAGHADGLDCPGGRRRRDGRGHVRSGGGAGRLPGAVDAAVEPVRALHPDPGRVRRRAQPARVRARPGADDHALPARRDGSAGTDRRARRGSTRPSGPSTSGSRRILEANRAGTAIRESAQRVADAAPAVQTALDNVSTRFTDAEARLNEARTDVTDRFDRIRTIDHDRDAARDRAARLHRRAARRAAAVLGWPAPRARRAGRLTVAPLTTEARPLAGPGL